MIANIHSKFEVDIPSSFNVMELKHILKNANFKWKGDNLKNISGRVMGL